MRASVEVSVVLDASFVAPLYLQERFSEFSRGTIVRIADRPLHASTVFRWEFANILRKKLRDGMIDLTEVQNVMADVATLQLTLHELRGDIEFLVGLADGWGLSSYDASYLDVAVQAGAELATNDKGLTKAARKAGLIVHSPHP